VNYVDDPQHILGDPELPSYTGLVLPRWNPAVSVFADGSLAIRDAFQRLIDLYGTPSAGSPVVDAAQPAYSPTVDILGRPRGSGNAPDLGAVERPNTRIKLNSIHQLHNPSRIRVEVEATPGAACVLLTGPTLLNWSARTTNYLNSTGQTAFELPLEGTAEFFRAFLP
jgi:hypothetical protein